ncbi:glycosyltransferase family 1 protein [Agreia sp. COWG]|uniref:glycosyltransferase family 1 protein n=1 Tax=Agreia sp. COWG TaxID=2773266 RepID=UPI001F1ADB4A|nr:glycosyltransferase family 1 protein [Agreia sp. COWG]
MILAPLSAGPQTIRVASVPASHVYVQHLEPLEGAPDVRVRRLADPHPDDPRRPAEKRWWPPAMLQSGWVSEHADEFDVFHLQFGFDARTPEQLRELVEELRSAGKPLVYTVHDLRNPHHASRAEHDAQLDVLIPAADAVITLTEGAAYEIKRRWARRAIVLAHPHVVDFDTMRRIQRERLDGLHDRRLGAGVEFRVGVHVKSLRANMNAEPVLRAIMSAVQQLPGAVLQVDGHRDILDPGGPRYDEALVVALQTASDAGLIDLRLHDYFGDDELWGYLASLDLSVLPYRFGTHSGWLEACRDLGTAVLAPSCGYYRDQAPVLQYLHDDDGLDVWSLQSAIRRAYIERPLLSMSVDDRRRQREAVSAAHADLYRELLR